MKYEERVAALGISRGKLADGFTDDRESVGVGRERFKPEPKVDSKPEPPPFEDFSHLNPPTSQTTQKHSVDWWNSLSQEDKDRIAALRSAKLRGLRMTKAFRGV